MSLSGADDGETRDKIHAALRKSYPNLCEYYSVTCDTVGPIATACTNGMYILGCTVYIDFSRLLCVLNNFRDYQCQE